MRQFNRSFLLVTLASVGLLVSGSYDSGEIAGNLIMLFVNILFINILFIAYNIIIIYNIRYTLRGYKR